MEFVPEIVLALVVVLMGAIVARITTHQYIDLRTDFGEMKQDMRDLRTEMNERFRDQGREIAALRSDVTQLALAINTAPRQTG
jgi:uncharacterized membrane-anchored protein YhcB (DUF1043 family)